MATTKIWPTKGHLASVLKYIVNEQKTDAKTYILGLGEQLKTLGLLVVTDAILNRVTENWKKGIRTHIILDEFHVVFENQHSANFFSSAWRRFRKCNAFPTAITQNVETLLDSLLARTIVLQIIIQAEKYSVNRIFRNRLHRAQFRAFIMLRTKPVMYPIHSFIPKDCAAAPTIQFSS